MAIKALSPQERKLVEDGLRCSLKDPVSVKFGEFVAGTDAKGEVHVCGWVNAKNNYGGFTGQMPFIGFMAGDSKKSAFLPLIAGAQDAQILMIMCKDRGLSLV